MKAQDLIKQNYPPSILIYGRYGVKKTALVSQLRNGYLFDFDKGMRTAALLKDKFFEDRNAIEFDIYYDENPSKPNAYMRAVSKMMNIVQACGAGTWDHDACVVDSITGLCRAMQLSGQAAQGDPFKKMEIQDWGTLVNNVEKFLTLMRSLRVLTVCTAHIDFIEKSKTDGRGKKVLGESEITDMFPSSATRNHGFKHLGWLFDEVWIAEKKPAGGGKWRYTVDGDGDMVRIAKTRSGIGKVEHDDIGMVGLLEKMGFKYGHSIQTGS